jgi:hypothetical protein
MQILPMNLTSVPTDFLAIHLGTIIDVNLPTTYVNHNPNSVANSPVDTTQRCCAARRLLHAAANSQRQSLPL